jgi:uncharacterized delta-60 repeat protein
MHKNFTLLLLGFSVFSHAQDGALDLTFSTDGKAYATAPSLNQSLSKTFVQKDGKVVIVGRAANCCGYDFSVARFNADGTPDATFDGDGVVVTEFTSSSNVWDIPTTVTVQPDGKILAAGISNQDFAIARYNLDGSLDATFDGDGKVMTSIGSTDEIYSIMVLPDGKILVGGTSYSGISRFALARYNPNGSLDASFGSGGIATHAFFSGNHVIYSLARQADGKIVAAGTINGNFAVARYNVNGTPDLTFSGDGVFSTDFFGNETAYSVAIHPDGRIIAAGVSDFQTLVMSITPTGGHDNSFDGDGIIKTTYSSSADAIYSILIQNDGKVVIAGTSWSATSSDFLVVRYMPNGALDPSFDGDGILMLDMGSSEAYATIMGWNNRLVVAGYSGSHLAVARLTNSSTQYILPLQLRTFTGNLQAATVLLSWNTVSELNTSAFEIERSKDGITFSKIGEVKAAGNSLSEKEYQYTDHHPIMGVGYYRMKMLDKDGRSTFSPIVMVRNVPTKGIVLFQNPVQSELRFQASLTEAGDVRIIDGRGAVVKQQHVAAGSVSLNISVADLPAGVYRIVVPSREGIQSANFIKN